MSTTEGEHILYIDDDVANLTVLEAVCAEEFPMLTASSGAAGLELLRAHEVAVLLVDQRMPGMTGVDVLVKARELRPDAVRVLITAYSDINEAIAAINQGQVERYVRKPWEPEELKEILREARELYRIRRRLAAMERRLDETERVYALGVVAAGVAHELRNPLAAIVPSLDLARQLVSRLRELLVSGEIRLADDTARKLGDLLDTAAAAAEQMTEITRGMELGQRRAGGHRQSDLREVVALTLRMLRTESVHRAAIVVEVEEVPLVAGTRGQLAQVALNLIVNALQAFPSADAARNRVTVRVRRADPTATIGAGARLEVEDNGPGIPEAVLARIFDPFFTTKEEGGTGLGLAISRRIVEEMGGRIDVESRPGQGTRFIAHLPAATG